MFIVCLFLVSEMLKNICFIFEFHQLRVLCKCLKKMFITRSRFEVFIGHRDMNDECRNPLKSIHDLKNTCNSGNGLQG
ncbi:MAG: hypothetical protein RRZ67_04240 [Victivallaceae bacterium]